MNAMQFYYARTVLGVSSFIAPQKVRKLYRLHYSSKKQVDFMFFCGPLHTKENKKLIQKIAQALNSSDYIIAEILQTQSPSIPSIINNLLTRFLPTKGFVIFGSDPVSHLTDKENTFKKNSWKITETVSINKNQSQSIKGCVLDTIDNLTGLQSAEIQERKKQAWNRLRAVFQL